MQDNWAVPPRLRLELGLRYEYNTVPRDAQDRIEQTFGPLTIPPNDPALYPPTDPDVARHLLAFNRALAGLQDFLAGRERIYDPDRNNLAPRFGFAFDPQGTGKTALRGGYGIYYDQLLGSVVSQSRNVFPTFIPFVVGPSFLGVGVDPFRLPNPAFFGVRDVNFTFTPFIKRGLINEVGLPPGGFRQGIGALLTQNYNAAQAGNGLAFTLPAKDLRTPYAQHYSLTLERELSTDYWLSVGYSGTRGTKLLRFLTPNLGPRETVFVTTPLPSTFAFAAEAPPGQRPDPRLGAYTIFASAASSTYHSLQLALHKRLSRSYQFTAAYTYSHAIDDVSDVFELTGAYVLPQNSFDLRRERGSANFDLRQRLALSGIWEIPYLKRNPVLGGWLMSGIVILQTGQPYTINTSIDVNEDGNLTDRLNTTNGLVRLDQGRTRVQLTPGASQLSLLAPRRQDGHVGRNTFRAPGFANVDLALLKRIRVSERARFEVRTELFNLFNRTHFGVPVRILEAPGFGQAVNTTFDAFHLQLALKFVF